MAVATRMTKNPTQYCFFIQAVQSPEWWEEVTPHALGDLVARLGPLMKFRQERRDPILSLYLSDALAVHRRIVTGPHGRDLPISVYRERVEDMIRGLLAENPVLQRIQVGEEVADSDLRQLAELLRTLDPEVDEERLRKVYDVRSASFLQLLRHVLGLEQLERWSTVVAREFDRFIAEHTTFSALQLRFVQTLRTFILQQGRVERGDLVHSPFTQLHPQGVRGVFPAQEIEELLFFAEGLVA